MPGDVKRHNLCESGKKSHILNQTLQYTHISVGHTYRLVSWVGFACSQLLSRGGGLLWSHWFESDNEVSTVTLSAFAWPAICVFALIYLESCFCNRNIQLLNLCCSPMMQRSKHFIVKHDSIKWFTFFFSAMTSWYIKIQENQGRWQETRRTPSIPRREYVSGETSESADTSQRPACEKTQAH